MIFILLIMFSIIPAQDVDGCTEPDAFNYNPDATIEDCSCEYEHHFTEYCIGCCGIDLIYFSDEISSLQSGDQIAVFDLNGLLSMDDCSNQYGEIMVGMADWHCEELRVFACKSSDFCDLGGTQFPGSIEGHQIHIRVYRGSEQQEYYAIPVYEFGFGYFGEIFTIISELQLIPAAEILIGCTDADAFNYSPEALFDDYSCLHPTPGDFDLNNSVNVIDIVIMVDYILFSEPGDLEFYVGDFDADGELTVTDLVVLVDMVLTGE